jgi:hypothetical protein
MFVGHVEADAVTAFGTMSPIAATPTQQAIRFQTRMPLTPGVLQ